MGSGQDVQCWNAAFCRVWGVASDEVPFNAVERRFLDQRARQMHGGSYFLNQIRSLDDLKSPGFRLEALRGDRAGQYSIRINDQWRVCFRWQDGDTGDVEIVDYH
jgi:proteic killer suppression protein